jgi:hypothetical protein
MWARPGAGVWFRRYLPGVFEDRDEDIPMNDRLVFRRNFEPVGTGPAAPAEFAAGDVIIVVFDDGTYYTRRIAAPLQPTPGPGSIDAGVEGNPYEGYPFTFWFYRREGTEGTVTVNYTTVDGTAKAGANYVAAQGSLVFETGEYIKTLVITTLNEAVYTGQSEVYFDVVLTAAGTTVNDAASLTQRIVLAKDDFPPFLDFEMAFVPEGDGPRTASVVATVTGATTLPVSVDWLFPLRLPHPSARSDAKRTRLVRPRRDA